VTITAPQGFRAAGVAAGIKDGGRLDLALVVNDGPGRAAAGVFTTNQVKAAPVLWSQQVLTGGALRAVVLNSGGANACTGPQGFRTAHATAERAAELLDCGAIEVAVCSTGIIGEQLPRDLLLAGVEQAAAGLSAEGATPAATAVLTTDSRPKQVHVLRDGWSVGGFAKGAGMLAPTMATMLVVLTTDAVAGTAACAAALRAAVARTFDRLDVDGGTSTNDTVLLLASGASGTAPRRTS
jgi:glutamate N-acetyltransferase/amino-acid N-acetyltransferase